MIVMLWTGDRPGYGPAGIKSGQVLDILPDDHQFLPHELADPNLIFVRVPLIQVEVDALKNVRADQRGKLVKFREYTLPLGLLRTFTHGVINTVPDARVFAHQFVKDA